MAFFGNLITGLHKERGIDTPDFSVASDIRGKLDFTPGPQTDFPLPGTEIKQKPDDESILRKIAQKIPGGFEEAIFDPIAKVGRFIAPTFSDQMKIALEEDSGRTQEQIESRARELDLEIGVARLGNGVAIDPLGLGGVMKRLTVKTLDRIAATIKKPVVSREAVENFLLQPDIKQTEKDIVRSVLDDIQTEAGEIRLSELSDQVQGRLLPLEVNKPPSFPNRGRDGEYGQLDHRYESITLSDELRGNVTNYGEKIYQSPIKNSAGDIHFTSARNPIDNYFAHTRIEDMADNTTRRVIEVQSDLFQKGNLERQVKAGVVDAGDSRLLDIKPKAQAKIDQLQPYRNTWWERVIREEVQSAAQDGKKTLQFPTGETAMKIEGLGEINAFETVVAPSQKLTPDLLKVGKEVRNQGDFNPWIITEVLEDGKFRAVPRETIGDMEEQLSKFGSSPDDAIEALAKGDKEAKEIISNAIENEQFDISGKIDTENPIYKFYEKDMARFLKNKYGAKQVTDDKGVTWMEMQVDKALADRPVEAFGGVVVGLEEDEDGNITVDPAKAFMGMAAAGILGKGFIRRPKHQKGTLVRQAGKSIPASPQSPQGKTPLPKVGQTKYPMSSEKLSTSLSTEYKSLTGKSINTVDSTLSPNNIDPKKVKEYGVFRSAINDTWVNVVEFIQDDMFRVRKLVKDPTVKITDETDPYLAEILFHGRVGARLTEARDTVVRIDQDIVATAKKNGVEDSEMMLLVNKFLHARHTPERNAQLGARAAGLSDNEAADILSEVDSLPYGGEVKRIAEDVQNLNNQTLDVLLENQVINEETYNTLRKTYKNHVPLQRVLDDDQDFVQVISGSGFDVKSTGIKRAKGSERQVADIMANVVTNYEQAVIRAEKNRVDLATLQFTRDNPELGLFKEIKAKPIGKTFGNQIITEQITDPSVLTLREKGKPIHIKIKDENLALALKGVNRHQVPPMMRFIRAFTRFYSGLQTRFNPEFAFPNKIRDLQEAVVYAGSRKELGFKGGVRAALDQKAYKDVLDNIRGVDTEGAKLYQQMIDDGGTTGGIALSTRNVIELDIEQIRRLNRSVPRQAADKFVRLIDNFNQIFEDSTRLSLYKEALNRGTSRMRAAEIAKEASVNFNKFGKGGPIINSLWMFSNASIQGTTKTLRSMKNPKVAAVVTASVTTAVYATGEWNDSIDPEWRKKVTEWDRQNALIVVLPSKDGTKFNYVAIPVGWGIKPIKVMADYAYDVSQGENVKVVDALNGIMGATINAYNPLGGTDIYSSVMPTILDIPSEVARNKAWHGGKIRPDWDQNAPASIKYFSSLEDKSTGRLAIQTSKGLSGIGIEMSPADIYYAYQGYIGGAGRTATDFVNTMIAAGHGELAPVNDIPVASRFIRSRDNEEIGAATWEMEQIDERLTEQSRERFYLTKDAEDSMRYFDSISQDKAKELFNQLIETNPEVANRINELKKQQELGLTYTQRRIKALGVENEERASFIFNKLESLSSDQERSELWNEYTEKKIITKDVANQLRAIINDEARPKYKQDQEIKPTSFIRTIGTYAKAIGTDPVTAFNRIFTGQRIRRTDSGAIIVERMSFTDSQEVRRERNADETMRLDHTIPLQLGGSNAESNLKLVPKSDWERYTAVENMLGNALRKGNITGDEAQELIKKYKKGEITSKKIEEKLNL